MILRMRLLRSLYFKRLPIFFFTLKSIVTPWDGIEEITYFPFLYFHGCGGREGGFLPYSPARLNMEEHIKLPSTSHSLFPRLAGGFLWPDQPVTFQEVSVLSWTPCPQIGMLFSAVCGCPQGQWLGEVHLSYILLSSFVSNKDDILISTCLMPASISQFWVQEGQYLLGS